MDPSPTLLTFLKKVPAFSELDDATLQVVQTQAQTQRFQPNEILCREGDPADKMFVIESGEVAVLKQGENGQLVEVTVLSAGQITGEMSLFSPAPRSATLRARGETTVWVFQYKAFQSLLEQHSALARVLLCSLSRHLRRETSVVARLRAGTLESQFRIAFFDSKPYMERVFRERNQFNYAIEFFETRLSRETVSMAAGFNAVCVFVNDQLDAWVIEALRDLDINLIALRCAGFNNVDVVACEQHSLSVVRVPAYSPYAVAEHAVALMLTLNRRIHRAHHRVREGNFSLTGLVGFDMRAKTAGLVGTGKIGKCLAQILAGFGCRLLAYDVFPDLELAARLGLTYVPLDQLLGESDLISLHAPLTRESRHLINASTIGKMKRGVMLINTSRGALIDTRALLDGLKTGQIGYAGLDVYEEESEYFFEDLSDQVITDDVLARLTTFPNVIVTSHQAFLTQEALGNIAEITLNNIREFESGKRGQHLTNRVTMTG